MKKYRLEDIKKDRVFTEPPADYFDKLPGVIQAKTAHKPRSRAKTYWMGALKLVPAAAAVVLILFYTGVLGPNGADPIDDPLAEVTAEDLIDYLATVELTTDELLDEVDFSELSLELLETDQDQLLENLDLDDDSLIELYGDFVEDES